MRVTRRGLQLALAVLWLLDAALQFQPYMFTRSFAHDVITPTGDGQPGVVAAPVHLLGDVVAAHPILVNAVFASIQLLLALGLFARRTARGALVASIAWSLGVWWLGEGFGGLLSGHAMLLTGAPGAVLLYAAIAAAAVGSNHGDGRGELPPGWLAGAWVVTWGLGAVFQLLPGQNTAASVATAVTESAAAGPAWLGDAGSHLAGAIDSHPWVVVALVVVQAAIAAAAAVDGAARQASLVAGATLAIGFWVFGQGLGELTSGSSTDPNSAPLFVLLAVAVAASTQRSRAGDHGVRRSFAARSWRSQPAIAMITARTTHISART